MRRRQIWAARAAAEVAAGTYAAIAPETPLDAVGVFSSAVVMSEPRLVRVEHLGAPVTFDKPPPFLLSEADLGKVTDMGEYKIDIEPTPELSSPPKRRGRSPKVKRDG